MLNMFLKTAVALSVFCGCFYACSNAYAAEAPTDGKIATRAELEKAMKYPVGDPNDGYAKYFSGQSFLAGGVAVDFHNVTFEPGCRNNWHVHENGTQILIGVGGIGWYQEWGKAPQLITEGTVIAIPPGAKHWHGAAKDSWFAHLATTIPMGGKEATNEWLEPISDEDYNKL